MADDSNLAEKIVNHAQKTFEEFDARKESLTQLDELLAELIKRKGAHKPGDYPSLHFFLYGCSGLRNRLFTSVDELYRGMTVSLKWYAGPENKEKIRVIDLKAQAENIRKRYFSRWIKDLWIVSDSFDKLKKAKDDLKNGSADAKAKNEIIKLAEEIIKLFKHIIDSTNSTVNRLDKLFKELPAK
ncbi:hypothetical protein HYU11_01030 [Candidatus Woesearchaeota archaeon]|nr:hypothetical protein [Candidatus Woesearchaeota archaeon]